VSKALTSLENAFNPNHPNIAEVLNTLAQVYQQTGNAAEAARVVKRMDEIALHRQVAYGPVAKAE